MPNIPRKNLRFVVSDDGAAILDIVQNTMTTLNQTGGFIWEQLQQGRSIAEISVELAAEANVTADVVTRDVIAFVEHLKSINLL